MTYAWPQDVLSAVETGEISSVDALRVLKDMDYYSLSRSDLNQGGVDNKAQRIGKFLNELDQLIGLTEVKKLVKEVYAFLEIQKLRQREQLSTDPLVLHMIFKGNPGTGKTTVARIMGKIFCEMGILSRGHLIEVERADLVGEYIGHTAQKTRDQLKKAYGGILFIDEAYSLARGGEKDFGKEAIDCMVKAMEDHKNELILILAGYQNEMEKFIRINPGLRSRFPIHIDFPDYNEQELLAIAEQMCLKRQYRFTPQSKIKFISLLNMPRNNGQEAFGNARTVRNIIEKAIRRQAVRLMGQKTISKEELMFLQPSDLAEVKE